MLKDYQGPTREQITEMIANLNHNTVGMKRLKKGIYQIGHFSMDLFLKESWNAEG